MGWALYFILYMILDAYIGSSNIKQHLILPVDSSLRYLMDHFSQTTRLRAESRSDVINQDKVISSWPQSKLGIPQSPPESLHGSIPSFSSMTLRLFDFSISPSNHASEAPKHPTPGGRLCGSRDLHRWPPPTKVDRLRSGLHSLAILGRHARQRPVKGTR